jgi:hypothetical protein
LGFSYINIAWVTAIFNERRRRRRRRRGRGEYMYGADKTLMKRGNRRKVNTGRH